MLGGDDLMECFVWSDAMEQVLLRPAMDDQVHVESDQLSQLRFNCCIVPQRPFRAFQRHCRGV